jgi:hypothetical protein
MLKRIRQVQNTGRIPTRISDWEKFYNRPRPHIAALLSSGRSGSHFALHKFHGHPALLCLEEHILNSELKQYFNFNQFPVETLLKHQLLPSKDDLASVEWIVLNKPKINDVTYHFPFQRQNIRLIQLIRNPITLYHSWKIGWDEMAQRDYGMVAAPTASTLDWLDRYILAEAAEFAYWRSPNLDIAISLESLASFPSENLSTVFTSLNVPTLREHELKTLTHCEDCRILLKVSTLDDSKPHDQAVLVCPKCKRRYLAAGGYNYIRKVDSREHSKWKALPDADELQHHFTVLLSQNFMDYFIKESYLLPDGHEIFTSLYSELLLTISRNHRHS